jgi:P27 family predicted phage terminase small subunit
MARPRKPALIREAEGNPGKRPIPKNELRGVGRAVAPAHLTPEQADRWRDIVDALPVALLTRADTQVLERMAVAWAEFRNAQMLINQSGLITRGQNNEPVKNPLLTVRRHAAAEMQVCGIILGLSPVARTRLTTPLPEQTADDPLDILMGSHDTGSGNGRRPLAN